MEVIEAEVHSIYSSSRSVSSSGIIIHNNTADFVSFTTSSKFIIIIIINSRPKMFLWPHFDLEVIIGGVVEASWTVSVARGDPAANITTNFALLNSKPLSTQVISIRSVIWSSVGGVTAFFNK